MARIGTRAHAVEVHNEYLNGSMYNLDHTWEEVGSGSYRTCYLHRPSDVVYKIPTGYATRGYNSQAEVRHARKLLKLQDSGVLPAKVRIPLTAGFSMSNGDLVVAMEHVKGRTLTYRSGDAPEGRRSLFRLGFGDMHEGNYMVEPGDVCVPIDMASPRWGRQPRTSWDGPDRRVIGGLPDYESVVFKPIK